MHVERYWRPGKRYFAALSEAAPLSRQIRSVAALKRESKKIDKEQM